MAALLRSPFRALVLVLAVGACLVAAKLADSILSDDQPPSPPAPVKPTPAAATNETEPPSPPSTEALASESAPSPKSDPQPAPESGDAVPTQLPLKLLGTLTAADPGLSLATVYEDTTQHSRTVWRGGSLLGAKVLAIERTRVLLSNKGHLEFLELSPDSAQPQGAASPAPSPVSASPPAAAPMAFGATLQQTGPNSYVIQRSDVDNMRAHLQELAAQGERAGAFRKGQWLGIKVVSLTPGSIYERLGLKPGDILVNANGFNLGMPPQEMQAYALLKTATRIDLDIERDGQILRKTYILQD
jgi:general secretion pathway protein C